MNARRCLKIAERIGTLLTHELGATVDAARLLGDQRYRRDVLLVCDAYRGHELAELASWFRRSAAEAPAEHAASSGFGLDSVFPSSSFGSSGDDSQRDGAEALAQPLSAERVRQELEQQRAAARRGGLLLAAR